MATAVNEPLQNVQVKSNIFMRFDCRVSALCFLLLEKL